MKKNQKHDFILCLWDYGKLLFQLPTVKNYGSYDSGSASQHWFDDQQLKKIYT